MLLTYVLTMNQLHWAPREYLDHCRVYEPALEILDEVQELNPVDPLEDNYSHPEKIHNFQSPEGALEQSNRYSQIVSIWLLRLSDGLDSLIGPVGLLLAVFFPFAVPISVLYVGLGKSK